MFVHLQRYYFFADKNFKVKNISVQIQADANPLAGASSSTRCIYILCTNLPARIGNSIMVPRTSSADRLILMKDLPKSQSNLKMFIRDLLKFLAVFGVGDGL